MSCKYLNRDLQVVRMYLLLSEDKDTFLVPEDTGNESLSGLNIHMHIGEKPTSEQRHHLSRKPSLRNKSPVLRERGGEDVRYLWAVGLGPGARHRTEEVVLVGEKRAFFAAMLKASAVGDKGLLLPLEEVLDSVTSTVRSSGSSGRIFQGETGSVRTTIRNPKVPAYFWRIGMFETHS